jgi:hypothetical protein
MKTSKKLKLPQNKIMEDNLKKKNGRRPLKKMAEELINQNQPNWL